jgi:uncharacterized protein YndB with AHSA1/START domain
MKKWLLVIAGTLLGIVLLAVGVGALLPREHQVSRRITLRQPAELVWNVITDYPSSPSWRTDIARVEPLPDRAGHPIWREIDKHGGGVSYETIASDPPKKLERKIVDEGLPYGGTWTFELRPTAGGTEVRITERGYVDNPVFRFISSFVIGHTTYMDTYLVSLGRKFAEDVEPVTVGEGT